MTDSIPIWLAAGICLLSCSLLLTAAVVIHYRRVFKLRENVFQLSRDLEIQRLAHEEKLHALEEAKCQVGDSFERSARQALLQNNELFLALAQEKFQQLQKSAEHKLELKESAIDHLVVPIKEILSKTEAELHRMEKDRKSEWGDLNRHLKTLTENQSELHRQTRNLVDALRKPEVRGRWGELTLKRLVELAGMVEHCDFSQQVHWPDRDGPDLRPDMIVHMPAGRQVVVDVKTPLDAYLSALEAPDLEQQTRFLQNHARIVKQRVRELSAKQYWKKLQPAPDFIVMFIPGDQFLSAALEVHKDLLEYGFQNKVIMATPSSMVAVLRSIAFGWQQTAMNDNARKIQQIAGLLQEELLQFAELFQKLGKSIQQSGEHYNKSLRRLEKKLMRRSSQLAGLGVATEKQPPPLEPVDP